MFLTPHNVEEEDGVACFAGFPINMLAPHIHTHTPRAMRVCRLLEDQSHLRPGDAVILNAANSTVGQTLVQLCKLLRLRCAAAGRAQT